METLSGVRDPGRSGGSSAYGPVGRTPATPRARRGVRKGTPGNAVIDHQAHSPVAVIGSLLRNLPDLGRQVGRQPFAESQERQVAVEHGGDDADEQPAQRRREFNPVKVQPHKALFD